MAEEKEGRGLHIVTIVRVSETTSRSGSPPILSVSKYRARRMCHCAVCMRLQEFVQFLQLWRAAMSNNNVYLNYFYFI